MELVHGWLEEGVRVPAPYARTIKVLLAPDRHGVAELTASFALVDPNSQTDAHTHDRPELMLVMGGRGEAVVGEVVHPIEPDVLVWVEAGEWHELRNTGAETLKTLAQAGSSAGS